jgi:hypothetical protein
MFPQYHNKQVCEIGRNREKGKKRGKERDREKGKEREREKDREREREYVCECMFVSLQSMDVVLQTCHFFLEKRKFAKIKRNFF